MTTAVSFRGRISVACFQITLPTSKTCGPHRKEALSYWRPLAALSGIAVSVRLASKHSHKGRKIIGATESLPGTGSERLLLSNQQTGMGRGWQGPQTHQSAGESAQYHLPLGFMAQTTSVSDSQGRAGPRITLGASDVLPSLHMESSSQRCQDKTWEQHLSSETTMSDSLFHTIRGGGHCNKNFIRWNLNPECSTYF